MDQLEKAKQQLRRVPRSWVVTGAAGFIGSHLAHALLDLDQRVLGVDNFETGERQRLLALKRHAAAGRGRFDFVEGDVRDSALCQNVCRGAEYVIHQAALISVPGSLSYPLRYHEVNVTGFLNLCVAAGEARVKRVVYASSCAVYGNVEPPLKREDATLGPISPYASTKAIDEQYGMLYERAFGLQTVGLRYFNAYGPGQSVGGQYGAVIPRWVENLLRGDPCTIYGDGLTTRDFCYVGDIVQANLRAATGGLEPGGPRVFNVGSGTRVSLRQLFDLLAREVASFSGRTPEAVVIHEPARAGEIRDIQADLSLARKHLGYAPHFSLERGARETIRWRAAQIDIAQPLHLVAV